MYNATALWELINAADQKRHPEGEWPFPLPAWHPVSAVIKKTKQMDLDGPVDNF